MRFADAALPTSLELGLPLDLTIKATNTAQLTVKMAAKIFLYDEAYLSKTVQLQVTQANKGWSLTAHLSTQLTAKLFR